jgi:hypothetical protein
MRLRAMDSEPTLAETPFQLLPPLTSDEYDALKAHIQTNGIMVPLTAILSCQPAAADGGAS